MEIKEGDIVMAISNQWFAYKYNGVYLECVDCENQIGIVVKTFYEDFDFDLNEKPSCWKRIPHKCCVVKFKNGLVAKRMVRLKFIKHGLKKKLERILNENI
jgi:hypothetical protein